MFKAKELNRMPLSELLYHYEKSGMVYIINDGFIRWAKWEAKQDADGV